MSTKTQTNKTQTKFIPSISEVDSTWLTEQLQAAGYSDAVVKSLEKEQIGTGQMARCFRLKMDVHSDDPTVPSSFILKVTSDDELSKKAGSSNPTYRREVEFYQKFYDLLSIKTPRCYFAEIADNDLDFAILLEDMTPADQGDQLLGCSVELTKKAIMELPGLHAPTWNHPAFFDPTDSLYPIQLPMAAFREPYGTCVETYAERHGHTLPPEQLELIQKLARHEKPFFEDIKTQYALVHMDYRLDNLLITPDSDDPELTVVDWQTYDVGNPLIDVAFFIGSSLLPEVRREVEEGIVREYHQQLIALGVTGFDWDDCWLAYRIGSLYGCFLAVSASVMVKRTERGDEIFRLMADRSSRHALDLRVDELFE